MLSAPQDKAGGKIWEGNCEASALFDGRVHKPALNGTTQAAGDSHAHLVAALP